MLGCWDEFQGSEANSKHQLSCFIYRSCTPDAPCAMTSVMLVESWVMATKVSVTSGKVVHAFHAVFLSIPNIADVTSHPVNEWKKRSAWQQ